MKKRRNLFYCRGKMKLNAMKNYLIIDGFQYNVFFSDGSG